VSSDRNEQRLYELIWKRTVASQMADARLERTTATISIAPTTTVEPKGLNPDGTLREELVATGEVVKFDGFLKVYIESTDNEEDEENKGMLPPLTVGQALLLGQMKATQRFSRPAPRYTEASLVKKLEELGIGRPSTYAPTISTVQKRGYVLKEDREGKERLYKEFTLKQNEIKPVTHKEITGAEKSKLFPTDVAMIVNDFLVQHFPNVVDFSFTATVEDELDEIARGNVLWEDMIDNFYQGFKQKVDDTQDVQRSSVGTSRSLGVHPDTGEPMSVKLGRFGPYVQIGEAEAEQKPRFASLKKGQMMERISMQEALELFRLPREVGTFESSPMTVAVGRFGPYIKHENKYYSLGKTDDPFTVTEERGAEIIQAKRKADAEKYIQEFPENPDIKVLNGRFGPYISAGDKNVKIPKGKDPKSLTLEECLQLAAETPDKKGKGRFGKAAASKATTKTAAAKTAKTTKAKTKVADVEAADATAAAPKAVKPKAAPKAKAAPKTTKAAADKKPKAPAAPKAVAKSKKA
jgi:DNA topoisomerase-1